jgi:glyoxylase-like metal-dependent hydrolase (beta-lactamase superfamily II)
MSIGRTDFEGGSWTDMTNSLINVLAKLPANTKVYPGHGEPTTIGDELRYNPYMR